MPLPGLVSSHPQDVFLRAASTLVALLTSRQMICESLPNATSSPESADGLMPSNSPDGQTISQSGPQASPANPSASPERDLERTTSGTSGPCSVSSSESAGHQSYSGSKSRRRQFSGASSSVRTCRKCGTEKPCSEFYANSKGHLRTACKACEMEMERARKSANPKKVSDGFRKWRKSNRGNALVAAARFRAKVRNLPFDLDVEEIQSRINAGVCDLTGIPFALDPPRAWNAPSLDRIVPELGYVKSNVRVVLYSLNVMANTWGPNRILEIASAISARRVDRSNNLSRLIGEKLKQRLSRYGSMEYELTWSEKVTPSGHVVPTLRASARRISDNASTGEPSGWPTPVAHEARLGYQNRRNGKKGTQESLTTVAVNNLAPESDPRVAYLAGWGTPTANTPGGTPEQAIARKAGLQCGQVATCLSHQAQLTGWATPTSSLAEKGVRSSEGGIREAMRNHGPDLAAMASLTPGPTTTSSHAETGKSAALALNPFFSAWLMGYPQSWGLAGIRSAMKSKT